MKIAKIIFNAFLLLILFSCENSGSLQAQTAHAYTMYNDDGSKNPIIHWDYSFSKKSDFKLNDIVTITFSADVPDYKWHLYSSQPTPEGAYKPTEFYTDKKNVNVTLVGPLKEQSKPFEEMDAIMGGMVRFFKEHKVKFKQDIKITGANAFLSGSLEFQVCISAEVDPSGKCIPGDFPVTMSFPVAGAIEAPAPVDTAHATSVIDSNKIDTAAQAIVPVVDDTAAAKPKEEGCKDVNLWLLFLEAFLLGFAAVLTPCVFPMIPLTVSFFTKNSSDKKKGVRNALLYGFFIVFMYTGLGLLISAVFGPTALYAMSINPWVNLGFFVMLFVFALSFLGMFEITLPSSWVNKMDEKSERGGILGIFFMALTLALVSFSCTGPLVGTALVEAASGGCVWSPIISMLGFSSALAIPFCLFAIFPGWLNSLPKSGGWLNSVKVVLGFLELALGMKFLSQADLVMKWHLLDREIFIGAWIVIFGCLGLYLIGKLVLPHDSPSDRISVPRLILGMFTFAFVLYLVPGLWGARLAFVSGLIPPPNTEMGVRILGQKESNAGSLNGEICAKKDRKYLEILRETESHGFCTFFDIDDAIAFAAEKNKPLFIDFTGHTCANCRQMEQKVWSKPEVNKILKEQYVMVSLYTDEKAELEKEETVNGKTVSTLGKKWLNYQIAHYSKYGQPYYVLMDLDKSSLNPPRGYTGSVEEYAGWLQDGVERFGEKHGK